MAKVSVIVPLYNKASTIERAMRSILAQSFDDFDVHIVDDGSTDGSLAALAAVSDPRLHVTRQDNRGPGSARNRGARQSDAPLLAFLDADDEWESGYLQTAVRRLDSHADAAAHVGAYFKGPGKTSTKTNNLAFGMAEGLWRVDPASRARRTKRYIDFCHSSCVMVRRDVFDRYGGFYDKDRCLYGEDSYLWLMLVMNHTLFLDPDPLVWFHSEDSALGERLRGRHPRRPALVDPEPLRSRCDPSRRAVLEDLLAFYRLLETESLLRSGKPREIPALRKAFPWPRWAGYEFVSRELKIEVRRLASAFGS